MVVAALGVCGLCWLWAGQRLGEAKALDHGLAAWWSLVGAIVAGVLAWASTIAFHIWWRAHRSESGRPTLE